MKHTYTVTGMTCINCKSTVENALKTLDEIDNIEVNLERNELVLYSDKLFPLELVQSVLPSKYQVMEGSTVFGSTKEKTQLRQLVPLFIILGIISVIAIFKNINPWSSENFMLDFMGLFYVVFSFFKLLDLKGFPASFSMYDPLAKVVPVYGYIYPFLEVVLGLMFLLRFEIPIALIVTIMVLGVTTVGVTKTLLDKKSIQCACLGTVLKLPMTKATFIENSIMIIMAFLMLLKTYN